MTKQLSLAQLPEWCKGLVKEFSKKQIILLKGDLGAGKTELVKHFVTELGGEHIASPTYSLIHEYPSRLVNKIIHVDLYRIENEEDLESTGFWDLFEEEMVIFIEWPERLPQDSLPVSWDIKSIEIKIPEMGSSRSYYLF